MGGYGSPMQPPMGGMPPPMMRPPMRKPMKKAKLVKKKVTACSHCGGPVKCVKCGASMSTNDHDADD